MSLKKILIVLAIAVVIFYVIDQPDSAAASWGRMMVFLHDGAKSVTRFLSQLGR